MSARYASSLELVRAALEARDEQLARRALDALFARRPEGAALELARAFDTILRGREICAELGLALESQVLSADEVELLLVAHNSGTQDLELELVPPSLVRWTQAVDQAGRGTLDSASALVETLERLRLPAGQRSAHSLGRFRIGVSGALAVRDHWRLEFRAGQLQRGSERLPLQGVRAEDVELVRIADFLPSAPVPLDEFLRYASGERLLPAALMERSVRLEPKAWNAALDALAAQVESLGLERLEELGPALGWLAREPATGADALAWRRWLRDRARRAQTPARGSLELPAILPPA